MGTVSIDDVTLRVLRAAGTDVDGWITALPTQEPKWLPRELGGGDAVPDRVSGSYLLLLNAGACPVNGSRVTLADDAGYTRGGGGNGPGPQLTIRATYPESVMLALTGRQASAVLGHHALAACTIRHVFRASGWTYVNLDVPMHEIDTARDLAAENREAGIRCDRMLARSGSAGARRRLLEAGVPLWEPTRTYA